jgi:hypothetical protein
MHCGWAEPPSGAILYRGFAAEKTFGNFKVPGIGSGRDRLLPVRMRVVRSQRVELSQRFRPYTCRRHT